jgi:hypothetical protein
VENWWSPLRRNGRKFSVVCIEFAIGNCTVIKPVLISEFHEEGSVFPKNTFLDLRKEKVTSRLHRRGYQMSIPYSNENYVPGFFCHFMCMEKVEIRETSTVI